VSVVKSFDASCLFFVLILTVLVPTSFAQEEKQEEIAKLPTPLLDYVETVEREDLNGVNTGTISADGKFLYSSAWRHGSINVFRRDLKTGKLTHVQSLTSENLGGATSIKLSADGKYAVAPAFQARVFTLMHVDPKSGRLKIADTNNEGGDGAGGLSFPIMANFSPDSKFVYGCDGGTMVVYKITDDSELQMVETNSGEDNCFSDARWVTLHPKQNVAYSTCNGANTVVVSKRDTATGKLTVKQIIRDDIDGVTGLQGAITSALSPDAKYLYVSSGRFSGDTAIGVYAVKGDELEFVHELFGGDASEEDVDMDGFLGSNGIMVSPDGKCVFAAGTRSQSFVCLQRNPKTGELTHLETIPDGSAMGEDEQELVDELGIGAVSKAGVAGIAISPDSRFVYVFVEDAGLIRVFVREDLKENDEAKVAEDAIK